MNAYAVWSVTKRGLNKGNFPSPRSLPLPFPVLPPLLPGPFPSSPPVFAASEKDKEPLLCVDLLLIYFPRSLVAFMASARSGRYYLSSVAAVTIAAVLGCLVAGSYAPKVCLNKLDPPLRQADLSSNPSTSLFPLRPEIHSPPTRLHCRSTPTPPPLINLHICRSKSNQAQPLWTLTRWARPPASTSSHIIHHW
jgi:hypothetical protein